MCSRARRPGALLFTCCSTPQHRRMGQGHAGARSSPTATTMRSRSCTRCRPPRARSGSRSRTPTTRCLAWTCLCIGLGRVGISVAQAFEGIKSRVSLAARNPAQLARAWAMNLDADRVARSGEPHRRVRADRELHVRPGAGQGRCSQRTRPDVVIIDLCSPPGSVDFEAAKALGRKVIWARAQAGRAPQARRPRRMAGADAHRPRTDAGAAARVDW